MLVNVAASEPILIASLKYWQDGQPISTAVTQSTRLNDQTAFAFSLSGIDTTHHYRYELTLTDRVGSSQTLPQGVLNTPPAATVSLNTQYPQTNHVLTAIATKSDADNDPVSLTYVWKVNGTVKRTFISATALSDTFSLSAAGNGDSGDTIVVEVTPNDGILAGTPATEAVTVVDAAEWSGGGLDNKWTTAANWIGNGVPLPGDNLVFPGGTAQLESVNDYPPGTKFGEIRYTGGTATVVTPINATTINVQAGQLTAASIVADTLVIGAGCAVVIAPSVPSMPTSTTALPAATTSTPPQSSVDPQLLSLQRRRWPR